MAGQATVLSIQEDQADQAAVERQPVALMVPVEQQVLQVKVIMVETE